jgi:hypothetical protein
MTKRLTAALRAHRHLRSPRVLCDAGQPLTQKVEKEELPISNTNG